MEPRDILGKPIRRILQTPWEHKERYSNCDFYIELEDDTLFEIQLFGQLVLIDPKSFFAGMLIDIETDGYGPACWSEDGFLGVGAEIRRVMVWRRKCGPYSNVFFLLSTQHWITTDPLEFSPQLVISDRREFLKEFPNTTLYDYWTREPYRVT